MDSKTNDTMKYFRLILSLFLVSSAAHAEHLFEVGVRAGLASNGARSHYVSSVPGIHGGMQVGYAYHSRYVVGFRVAATMERAQTGYSKIDYTDSYSVIDVENEEMQVDYTIGHLRETHTSWSVGFPVQLALAGKNFYLYCGPKIVFPFSGRWSETAENAALSVYYPQRDNRVYDSYPLAASPSFSESLEGESLTLPRVQFWMAAEVGYDIPIHTGRHTKSYISLGVYVDYSLSSLSTAEPERISLLMLSDTRDGFPLHRILTFVEAAQRQGVRLVSGRRPFDVGVKISYRIAPYSGHHQSSKKCRCYGISEF